MPRIRWHIAVFLAPAVLVYTAVMIFPLFDTLRLALYGEVEQARVFVGLDNFRTLFGDPRWAATFWNALGNNFWFFVDPHAGAEPDRHRAGGAPQSTRGCASPPSTARRSSSRRS